MRRYSFGVAILALCGALAYRDDFNQGRASRDDNIFERDRADFHRPGDRGVEDDVAYWESIYGTEDVPDFQTPPPIAGESIFMDLEDSGGTGARDDDRKLERLASDATIVRPREPEGGGDLPVAGDRVPREARQISDLATGPSPDGPSRPHLTQEERCHGRARDDSCDAYRRPINLDANCSGIAAFANHRPERQRTNAHVWRSREPGRPLAPVAPWTIETQLGHGRELAIEMQGRAKWLCDEGFVPKLHTPAMLHLMNNFATENTIGINAESEFSLFGAKLLQRELSSESVRPHATTPDTFADLAHGRAFGGGGAPRQKRCPVHQMYRSLDGSCNNQIHPTWGKSDTAFARILPARYHDGIHQPAMSVSGEELPNPRVLSANCFSRKLIADTKVTLALAQWGQVLSHDFALQTIDRTVGGGIQCCDDGSRRQLPKDLQHHSCLPVDVPADDAFYSQFGFRCMNFVRSTTIAREDRTLGPADQLNTVTSYLDASPLYGSSKETCDKLRSFRDGRLLVAARRGREMLPTATNGSRACDAMSPNEVCYLAGDHRVNQNPQLALVHTILLREHNGIADRLKVVNPHWDDERIFQETRRIVIAEYQRITYDEWLPVAIGGGYCRKHGLGGRRGATAMSRGYDPRIKAATINSFATAAFRVFHSTVDGNINFCPADRRVSRTLRLSDHYFRPGIIERDNNLDDLARGLVTQNMMRLDGNFHPEVAEYLFRSRNEHGIDLQTLDVQRGRDHGLPGYVEFRKICGLSAPKNFHDLHKEISSENIEKLKRFYHHVRDIDLIVGMILENKIPGGVVGPVARCLIGEQFYRCKSGDRYFYSNADQPHSFSQEQFQEIGKASLARLLCDNGDNIGEIQPEAFKRISSKNLLTRCSSLPKIDLTPWRELNRG